NANYVNAGTLLATNWGSVAAGTLFISTGDAASNGGFSNTAAGTIIVASNMTLTVNRSQHAWAAVGAKSVANDGTIVLQGGSLNLASDGIVSHGASLFNTCTISGTGTVDTVVMSPRRRTVFAECCS